MATKKKAKKETPTTSGDYLLSAIQAPVDQQFWLYLTRFGGLQDNPDIILKKQTPQNAEYDYPWGLYEEMLDLDPHLDDCIRVRAAGLISLPWLVEPADDSERAKIIASFVYAAFDRFGWRIPGDGGFDADRRNIFDAIGFGLSVMEIDWDLGDFWLPRRLLHRPLRQFKFDTQNRLRIMRSEADMEGEPVRDMKFLVFSPYRRYENPYGIPALRKAFFYSWFKRQGFKFWAIFADKFASPTVYAKSPKGMKMNDPRRAEIEAVIMSIQQETGIIVPEDFLVELLEARRSGKAEYGPFIEACDRQTSKAILGLAVSVETMEASYGAATVHQRVRSDIREDDARAECKFWNNTLIPWLVDLNFAEPRLYPKFVIRTEAAAEQRTRLEILTRLAQMGFPLSKKQMRIELHLNEPQSPEDEYIAPPTAHGGGSQPWGNPSEGQPGGQPGGKRGPAQPKEED